MRRRYQLHWRRGLWFTNGAIYGPTGVVVVELLVDTGAAFSLLSPAILRAVGGVLGIDFLERFPLQFELDLGIISERCPKACTACPKRRVTF